MTGKLEDSHYSWLHKKPIRDNSNFWQWPDCHTLQPDPYWKSILAAPTLSLFQSGDEHAGVWRRKNTTLKGKWGGLDLNLINAAPASWELLIGPDRVVKVINTEGNLQLTSGSDPSPSNSSLLTRWQLSVHFKERHDSYSHQIQFFHHSHWAHSECVWMP